MDPSTDSDVSGIRIRPVAWSLALVLSCGLLLGYFVLHTFYLPKHRQYQLDFGNAQWIEPADPGPTAYFRKNVFLSAVPDQAWLEVSAMDNFKAIVNGHTVGSGDSLKTRVVGIYDIKKALKVGTNAIAVSVARTSFPGAGQVVVRGYIKVPGADAINITSDESWKAITATGIVQSSEDWASPRVQDEQWPAAKRSAANDERLDLAWADMNPKVLQSAPAGAWITSGSASSAVTFSSTFSASRSHQETWLQAASSGDLDLTINGHIITSVIDLPTSSHLPHLAAQEAEPTPSVISAKREERQEASGRPPKATKSSFAKANLDAYDISYWVKSGANSIVATVRADHRPATLLISGFVTERSGQDRLFTTNSQWLAKDRLNRNSEDQQAVELGGNGASPWGYLPQTLARAAEHGGFGSFIRSWLIVLLTAAGVVALWLLISGLAARWHGEILRRAMVRDALLHAPLAIGLVFLLLPNYDFRYPADWAFRGVFVLAALFFLFGVRLFHLFPIGGLEEERKPLGGLWGRRSLPILGLIVIMAFGMALRFHNITFVSFDHDEMGLVSKSRGVFETGYPYVEFAGEKRWTTTYEAVPYPLAVAGLFGYSELTMRLPACIFGTLCIGLIGLLGRRLFNWRTGLIAAFVYACISLDIRWSQNAFYPQQCQFMAMLTVYLFYEAIRFRPFRAGYLTGAAVAFCFTYLSWEGSAFLLPSLFIGLLCLRWGEWWWIKGWPLYRCLFFVAVVVIAQYCSRAIAGVSYLQVGSGLSNLTGPSLFFLKSAYQPMFYVDKLWLSEGHVFFTVFALLGLPFCWSHRGFRYLFSILVSLWVCHTNFIAALSPRYCYYYQPFLVLSGVAAAVMLYDHLRSLARRESGSPIALICAHVSGVAVLLLIFFTSNEWLLREYNLSSSGDTPGLMTRLNSYKYDYRSADQYVKAHLQPGDVVLPGIPHVYAYYTGAPADYFLDTLLSSKVPYDQTLAVPVFVDKFSGLPVIRNLTELQEVVKHARRTWVIFAPYASFEKLNNPNVIDYLDENSRSLYETYRAKVYLIDDKSKNSKEPGTNRTASNG